VRLTAPGYQTYTAFTWNFDSALDPATGWHAPSGYWWGGPNQVWFHSFAQGPGETWQGPYTDARVLYSTHGNGTIFVNEYQWNAATGAWDRYDHNCALSQWIPSLPYGFSWPSYM